MQRIIGNILIIIGLLLAAFVGYEQLQAYQTKKKLMNSMSALNVPLEETATAAAAAPQAKAGVELHIPKIDLTVPVFEGSSRDVLSVAIGHLEQSGRLGAMNENFVLLGHRSHTTGRFFNRLDEMEIGDQITITAGGKVYKYEAIEKKVIKPTQLEVIEPRDGMSLVTLITCHPLYSSKQRLVVTCKQV